MRRFGQFYNHWLNEAPLLTKVLTAGTLTGVGDRIAQRLDPVQDDEVDHSSVVSSSTARTLRMMVWGGLFVAPITHTWLYLIERAVPGTGRVVVAKKVVADMVIMSPAMSLGFFTATNRMEGASLSASFETAKSKLLPTLSMSYRVWPFANAISFAVVPMQYRLLFANCVGMGWSVFLSNMANKPAPGVGDN